MRRHEAAQRPGKFCDICEEPFTPDNPAVIVMRPTDGLDAPKVAWPYHASCRDAEARSRRITMEDRGGGTSAQRCIDEAPCRTLICGGKP